ncbi:AMIN-like domain-containing (lipo)protein [Corynebacterium crudilactis]|uniref:AMIN-like domain-containing protein n=1 Tax=Corynebacterium crudilactis TaxID=1652495 RepID=A0A172QRH8_9CORY|nr:hypothetical protein [Corynebacterium crudilactis]ANE03303.1 hypothetical protein ccrud_03130 [Corynebacterium crudilactis]
MIVQPTSLSKHRARFSVLAILSASALALAGCGTSTSSTPAGSATQTMSATADGAQLSNQASTGPTALGEADVAMKTLRPEAPAQLMVTGVRIGSHSGFDRVVFDLTGQGDPGWFIDYTSNPTQQGSGNPIKFTGDTALNVNIDGTVYPFDLGLEDPAIGTVDGSGSIVSQVISAGTFEGRSQFVIGLNGKHPYSVNVLQDPPRLVVDVLAK